MLNGDALPASHSARPLGFTAHLSTAGARPPFTHGFQSTLTRMHCEEEHNVEATLP